MRRLLLALAGVLAVLPAAAQTLPADQAALKAHVQFLASDALKGRAAGSHEFDVASEYVAAQMAARGLKPGANGKWFQPVRLANSSSVTGSPAHARNTRPASPSGGRRGGACASARALSDSESAMPRSEGSSSACAPS